MPARPGVTLEKGRWAILHKKKAERSVRTAAIHGGPPKQREGFGRRLTKDLKRNYILYLMILPVVAYFFLFSYVPMAGAQLAFKDYLIKEGIWGSPWVGWKHFARFFSSYNFWDLLRNTLAISLYCLVVGTVVPILFSVLINYVRNKRWQKTLQMVTYLPYFISNVVLVGMLTLFLGDSGILNTLLERLGLGSIPFMSSAKLFRGVYTWSGVWQGLGYSAVIYIAALAGVDVQLHEAAIVDGASIWRRIWHIDLVALRPTIVVLFIMSLGNVINVGYEKVLLMQNSLNLATSEVLSTYIYKMGLINSDYGFSTAVGLFNSIVSMVLLFGANRLCRKLAGYSLW